MNTHTYDGKLETLEIPKYSETGVLEKLRSEILESNPEVIIYYDQIVQDQHGLANYDPTNRYDAYDLLVFLAHHRDKFELNLLIEQLQDLKTGNCPQGRATRLYQIVYFIWPSLFPSYFPL